MGNKDRRVARIWKEIDAILWSDWDPIGVNDAPEARDEYYSYIGTIFHLLEDGAGSRQISQKLHSIETKHMGLTRPPLLFCGNCKQVAEKLRTIDLSRHADE